MGLIVKGQKVGAQAAYRHSYFFWFYLPVATHCLVR